MHKYLYFFWLSITGPGRRKAAPVTVFLCQGQRKDFSPTRLDAGPVRRDTTACDVRVVLPGTADDRRIYDVSGKHSSAAVAGVVCWGRY